MGRALFATIVLENQDRTSRWLPPLSNLDVRYHAAGLNCET